VDSLEKALREGVPRDKFSAMNAELDELQRTSYVVPEGAELIEERGDLKTWKWRVMSGSFTLTDDKIELTDENGHVLVLPFSRTENTINIGGDQFTRKK